MLATFSISNVHKNVLYYFCLIILATICTLNVYTNIFTQHLLYEQSAT